MHLISRREALAGFGGWLAVRDAMAAPVPAVQGRPVEWSFHSNSSYRDPFHEVELDVEFTHANGTKWRVPAFWAGEQRWTVRFAPPLPGEYAWRSFCSDTANGALQGRSGQLQASAAPASSNPLFAHGPVRVAPSRRHLQHADGTPFFWLADTWWMGLTQRLRWPEDFHALAADRVQKGFTTIQIVAGLYPDMPAFDERGANEAGQAWEPGWRSIRPEYFDLADVRMQALVDAGLMPCIVGCWGYYLPLLGAERMKKHWRYLVARWSALPVVWCLAGEGTMPYYLSKTPKEDAAAQKAGWTEMARYVRSLDPAGHPITIHPSRSARETVSDPAVLDFDMLQTGHSDRRSFGGTVQGVTGSYRQQPVMPVIDGEVCYEGIGEASRQEVQRFTFWACVLSGAAGHTYGANGIWQVNTHERPYGPSPHGRSWGDTPWDVAAQLPGSKQVGLAKQFLMQFPWWQLEPHPEWVTPRWSETDYLQPYCAGIPGRLRILYLPTLWNPPVLHGLEPGKRYRARWFDPVHGSVRSAGEAAGDEQGNWTAPTPPVFQDWVLVLEAV